MRDRLVGLLDRLLITHSPSGEEGEMDALCHELLAPLCDDLHADPAGNLIGRIAGASPEGAVAFLAHKDEIGGIVRKIDDDGKVWLEPLGGSHPWAYGEGPFDLLGKEALTGVLSVGSKHSSHLSGAVNDARTKALTWEMCYVDCKLDAAALRERGVSIGTRACVARSRKAPLYMGDCVAGWALDDKAGVAALVLCAETIRELGRRPPRDIYLAVTSNEEIGCAGGACVARSIPADTHIAVEIAPVAPEYSVAMGAEPVIFYKDALFTYHKPLADDLAALADETQSGHQRLIARSFGSDTSVAYQHGLVARAGCVGFATDNTHGYEVAHLGGIEACARLLAAYACRP